MRETGLKWQKIWKKRNGSNESNRQQGKAGSIESVSDCRSRKRNSHGQADPCQHRVAGRGVELHVLQARQVVDVELLLDIHAAECGGRTEAQQSLSPTEFFPANPQRNQAGTGQKPSAQAWTSSEGRCCQKHSSQKKTYRRCVFAEMIFRDQAYVQERSTMKHPQNTCQDRCGR